MTAHRLAVVGSRACSPAQFSAVMRVLDREAGDATIVTGDAAGVDEAARFWARHCGAGAAVVHVADWAAHRDAAGPIRNAALVADADELVAFVCRHPSRGTADAATQARRRGIKVRVLDLTTTA